MHTQQLLANDLEVCKSLIRTKFNLDTALVENKKNILKELESRCTVVLQNNLGFKLSHHNERIQFLADLHFGFENLDKPIASNDFDDAHQLIVDDGEKMKVEKKSNQNSR